MPTHAIRAFFGRLSSADQIKVEANVALWSGISNFYDVAPGPAVLAQATTLLRQGLRQIERRSGSESGQAIRADLERSYASLPRSDTKPQFLDLDRATRRRVDAFADLLALRAPRLIALCIACAMTQEIARSSGASES